ncbi:DUF1045 domain-containing protein [Arthrobacter sp. M4]|uniref:DUF1045 domain-containing protein n=1 Tax=Arthrobacter sp. M4 TaxID=218160 RepID=UPI001CDC253F|nr:DUF1045 domain-containing protein [Arthrobacter sp. M4]MCA4132577.1 DUF1045 domain-containing protein [Arthrobacter sp. M4]
MSHRYAVYALPGVERTDATGTLLRERAESWLGRSVTGTAPSGGVPEGWTRASIDRITADARRYGFHATLKAPFRLASGYGIDDLAAATARLASSMPPVTIPRLTISRINWFYAITPGEEAPGLDTLATTVVTELDSFRAPPSADEIARRKPDTLTDRQRALLTSLGYPYVLEEFRFHLTLTDRVADGRHEHIEQTLRQWFSGCLDRNVTLGTIALFMEPEPGVPFRIHSLHPLEGSQ